MKPSSLLTYPFRWVWFYGVSVPRTRLRHRRMAWVDMRSISPLVDERFRAAVDGWTDEEREEALADPKQTRFRAVVIEAIRATLDEEGVDPSYESALRRILGKGETFADLR